MTTIMCAWCGKVISENPEDTSTRVSHGICTKCAEKENKVLDEKIKGDNMLTIEKLKAMKPHTIFKSGFMGGLKWVAVRGGIHDWAIYEGSPESSENDIARYGNKVIKELSKSYLDVDDSAYRMYRD